MFAFVFLMRAQVGGSLEGKIVLDLMAIGADFVALTADGVVHEWNCYAPYTAPGADDAAVTIPQSLGRPSIPEPIELTPDFKSKVSSYKRSLSVSLCLFKCNNLFLNAVHR